jgi:hypothetical protein
MIFMSSEQEQFDTIADALAQNADTKRGKMFGAQCLTVNGKAFAALSTKGGMTFKLAGDDHARALAITGASLFDPSGMGRPMKEWVLVPASQSTHWPALADQARTYVADLTSQ